MKRGSGTVAFLGAVLFAGVPVAGAQVMPDLNPGCPGYQVKRDIHHNAAFWLWAAGQKQYTLIADTDHADPHMLSVLASEKVIKGWKEQKGVTDISLELSPQLHERIKPYLSPFDRNAVQKEFQDYMEERGLWTHGNWAEIRSDYLADFIDLAQKYGIHYHFISIDPQMSEENKELDDIYRKKTRVMAESCYNQDAVDGFLKSLGPRLRQDFERYTEEMTAQRLNDDIERIKVIKEQGHGGRHVILFGGLHVSPLEKDTIGSLLPPELRTVVEMYPGRSMILQNFGGDYLYFYDKGTWARGTGGPR